MRELKDVRADINAIDDEMTELFGKRMALSEEVAKIKAANALPAEDREREREIIFRLSKKLPEELSLYLKEFYETVFFTGKAYQSFVMKKTSATAKRLGELLKKGLGKMPVSATVACQGISGANSGAAAAKFFPISDITYFKNFEGVFSAVSKGLCEFGVLPIENSTAGSVSEVYDLMKKYNFHIAASCKIQIKHCLAALPEASLADIKTVVSHPQAILQCKEFLKDGGFISLPEENTAVAAKMVKDSGDISLAALCSAECAEIYGLKILKTDVQDNGANFTRFICIEKDLNVYKNADRISVMTSLSHEPGSLNRVLGRFSALGLNLTKIESRPIAGADFEFMFYFDFEGDIADKNVLNLISEMENGSHHFVFLGAYGEKA